MLTAGSFLLQQPADVAEGIHVRRVSSPAGGFCRTTDAARSDPCHLGLRGAVGLANITVERIVGSGPFRRDMAVEL